MAVTIITGTPDGDILDGTPGDDLIFGLEGFDFIFGEGGDDVVDGGEGDDVLSGGDGNDSLFGGLGPATYMSNYSGGAGDDWLAASEFGVGEFLYGGPGVDTVSFIRRAQGVTAVVSQPTTPGFDRIDEVENVLGSVFADTITGDDAANRLDGDDGNDVLEGGGGGDSLVGGAGMDSLAGGIGNDWFFVDSEDIVLEVAGEGSDRVFATTSYTLAAEADVELMSTSWEYGTAAIDLTGNESANIIYGNAGNNVLNGRGGADTLAGMAGNDWFFVDNAGDRIVEVAGEGSDRLFASTNYTLSAKAEVELMSTDWHAGTAAIDLAGNEFANIIYGNDGDNVLDGKGGSDTLIGWMGNNSFAFTTALGAGNVDRIVDFSGADDTIRLDDAVFTQAGGPGALDADAFHAGATAQDAEDRIVYNQATGQLFYDADGNGAGAAVLFARLDGAPALSASDFMVI